MNEKNSGKLKVSNSSVASSGFCGRWLKVTLITLGAVLGVSLIAHVITWTYFGRGWNGSDHGMPGHHFSEGGGGWGPNRMFRNRGFHGPFGDLDESGLELITAALDVLKRLDYDSDGAITRSDGESLFLSLDTNSDGQLDRDEQNVFLSEIDLKLSDETYLFLDEKMQHLSRDEWDVVWLGLSTWKPLNNDWR